MASRHRVFTFSYSLLIEKDICDRQNISIKFLCAFCPKISSFSMSFSFLFNLFFFFFCYPCFGTFPSTWSLIGNICFIYNLLRKWSHGLRPKKLYVIVAVQLTPVRVPSNGPLRQVSCQSFLSGNKGDNEVKLDAVHRSPGI